MTDVVITKIEPKTPEESGDLMRDGSIEITVTPSNAMDGNIERIETSFPVLTQSERNLRQMLEDENLIFSVQKFPIIYDRTNLNYQHKEQVRHVWNIIAESLDRSADYCHKRWRYLRDYFVRQLRYHRASTEPNKLKRPWVLFNKLTFLTPFVAHVVDKNIFETYSEATNGHTNDNNKFIQDYSAQCHSESNYYECDGTEGTDGNEIHDLTIDDSVEDEELCQQNHAQDLHVFPSNNKKRKKNASNNIEFQLPSNDFKVMERDKRFDEHDHFLLSLAPELRKIEPKYTLHFRNEVHNLIIKYQLMSSNEK